MTNALEPEIERLQDAKRRALALADERAKEAVRTVMNLASASRRLAVTRSVKAVRATESLGAASFWPVVEAECFPRALVVFDVGEDWIRIVNGRCAITVGSLDHFGSLRIDWG
jgi:hypothetical protein